MTLSSGRYFPFLPPLIFSSPFLSKMSTVSFQNELLPSFEPIEHASQKRKRATMKDGDSQPVNKKSRGIIYV